MKIRLILMGLFAPLLFGLTLVAVVKYPKIHAAFLMKKVGSRVVMITFSNRRGGGTGFHLKTRSGRTYIVTNAHICDVVAKGGSLLVQSTTSKERPIERRVLENSDSTDLCLVEPLPGIDGLSLGSAPEIGQLAQHIGHPSLLPLTLSKGQLIERKKVQVLSGWILSEEDEQACHKPKNKIEIIDSFFGQMAACLVEVEAYGTTIATFPGNSGSPLVDDWGRVLGVVFAGNNQTNWGYVVTFEQLERFIAPY